MKYREEERKGDTEREKGRVKRAERETEILREELRLYLKALKKIKPKRW